MKKSVRVYEAILVMAAAMVSAVAYSAPVSTNPSPKAPIHRMTEASACIREWVALGPLPKAKDAQTSPPRAGLDTDYLAALGGEARARLKPGLRLAFQDAKGTTRTMAAQRLEAGARGIADLNARYNMPPSSTAYAFAWIDSPADQEAQCFLGSGDGVKVWVDGKLVHTKPGSFFEQSCLPRQDQFSVKLRKGLNPLLLKTESGGGDWAFILEMATPAAARKIQAQLSREKQLKDFQNAALCADTTRSYIFAPGPLPALKWTDPKPVEGLFGKLALRARWFDGELNEVRRADKPGRYAAYVEADTTDGLKIRRAVTFFCAAPGDPALTTDLTTATVKSPSKLIAQPVWETQQEKLKGLMMARFFSRTGADRDTAIMLAGCADATAHPEIAAPWNTPAQFDQDYHFRLKLKILGGADPASFKTLAPPREKEGAPAPVIRAGTPAEAGFKPGAAARIRAACQAWATGGGEAFSVLVARHGVIVFHEAFSTPKRAVDTRTRFSLDSITKTVSSLFFLRLIDQGLIGVDDPVGKYLPDLPASGPRAITLRECLAHTSSLEGHGAFGGMSNAWLDNVIANAPELLHPGEVAIYNGTGFDLAGTAAERITGKNIFRLMHDGLFDPLGMKDVPITDLAFTAECTAEELARLGQLMLNRGAYGKLEFFKPATFDLMMPRPATELFPKIPRSDWEYGLGLTWTRVADPEAGKKGKPKEATILGRRMIGHGALSSSTLRVDLDNDMVIALTRAGGGKDNDKYTKQFMQAIAEGLE